MRVGLRTPAPPRGPCIVSGGYTHPFPVLHGHMLGTTSTHIYASSIKQTFYTRSTKSRLCNSPSFSKTLSSNQLLVYFTWESFKANFTSEAALILNIFHLLNSMFEQRGGRLFKVTFLESSRILSSLRMINWIKFPHSPNKIPKFRPSLI